MTDRLDDLPSVEDMLKDFVFLTEIKAFFNEFYFLGVTTKPIITIEQDNFIYTDLICKEQIQAFLISTKLRCF